MWRRDTFDAKIDKGPVWKLDTIPQIDGHGSSEASDDPKDEAVKEEVPEIIEKIRVLDFSSLKDLKDSEEDIDKILKQFNIQVIERKLLHNYRSNKAFVFTIKAVKSKNIFNLEDYLKNQKPNFTISSEF